MQRRILHLIGFATSFVTIATLAIAMTIRMRCSQVGMQSSADPDFFLFFLWIGSIGSFICASMVAVKTAWSFYYIGRLTTTLSRKGGSMISHRELILFLFVTMTASCRPPGFEIGGGGSTHNPPANIIQGEPTTLTLELYIWGEGSGKMSKRWKDVKCHYRIEGTGTYTILDMAIYEEKNDTIAFTCTIPPQQSDGLKLEYYFDMVFDGHYNRREGGSVKIDLPANQSMQVPPNGAPD